MATATDHLARYPSLTIGMEFDDLKAAKEVIIDAVIQARESFKVKNAEARFWALECYKKTQLACGFKVRLSLSLSAFANKFSYELPSSATIPNLYYANYFLILALHQPTKAGSGQTASQFKHVITSTSLPTIVVSLLVQSRAKLASIRVFNCHTNKPGAQLRLSNGN